METQSLQNMEPNKYTLVSLPLDTDMVLEDCSRTIESILDNFQVGIMKLRGR